MGSRHQDSATAQPQLTSLISLSYLNLVGFLSLSIFLSVPDIYKPILRSIHYSFLFSTFLISFVFPLRVPMIIMKSFSSWLCPLTPLFFLLIAGQQQNSLILALTLLSPV